MRARVFVFVFVCLCVGAFFPNKKNVFRVSSRENLHPKQNVFALRRKRKRSGVTQSVGRYARNDNDEDDVAIELQWSHR